MRHLRWGLADIADHEEDRDTLLQLLFSVGVESKIGRQVPAFVYDFPATQAALAQINPMDPRVAERFEVYFKGVELANGFHELADGDEQLARFEDDNRKRLRMGGYSLSRLIFIWLSHCVPAFLIVRGLHSVLIV